MADNTTTQQQHRQQKRYQEACGVAYVGLKICNNPKITLVSTYEAVVVAVTARA